LRILPNPQKGIVPLADTTRTVVVVRSDPRRVLLGALNLPKLQIVLRINTAIALRFGKAGAHGVVGTVPVPVMDSLVTFKGSA
jgi:hypothetical protein